MEKIIEKNVLEQHNEDMKCYALYINRVRIMPNIIDGLKFIHRRIVYGAYYYDKAITYKVKSSAVQGTVMKYMHPHGDKSIYDAMKPLLNSFEINMPLLEGQGNWGNFQGDGAAAARYTEVKISSFCNDVVIGELNENRNVVDWIETYNGTLEPKALPVKLPILLINGVYGIGYGVKVSVPTHNITEVINATLQLIDDPNSEIVLIPDQNTKCEIIETNFKSISNKGNGKFKVRGKIDIEKYKGKDAVVIRSVPDMVFLNTIVDKINEFHDDGKLPQIQETIDESDNTIGMKYVIILRKGSDPNYVRDFLYTNTDMQKTVSVNLEVLEDTNPIRMSYKSYLLSFIESRKLAKFRLYQNMLQKVKTKWHQKDAFIKAIQSGHIDQIIDRIKNQTEINDNDNIEFLVNTLNITDFQASYILNAGIKELSKGYLNKYIEEAKQYEIISNDCLNKIINDDIILNEIKQELIEYKDKYGKPRNCNIIKESDINNIPEGEFKIVVTQNNYIKKVNINDFIGKVKGDEAKFIIKASNTKNILLFDEMGRVFKLPVHKIPMTIKNGYGTDLRMIIKKCTSNICALMYEPTLEELSKKQRKYFMTVLTNNGNIKKLDIEDFLAVPPSGIIYIKLDPDDTVNTISTIAQDLDVIVYSKNKALRMNMSEIPHQKRTAKGVKAMSTTTSIDGLSIIFPSTTSIITVTENGYINKSSVTSLPSMGRNRAGSNVIKLHKGDLIHSIFGLSEDNVLNVITSNEKYTIPVSDIEMGSSVSVGKKLIPMKNNNIIYCAISK